MSGPENTFIASVHKHLPPINEFYWMKNHNEYNGGIADCWYSDYHDLWIEYKFLILPKRTSTIIDLTHRTPKTDSIISSLQQEWIKGRRYEGRNVWVIVGCKEGGVVFTDLSWANTGNSAGDYRGWMQSRSEIAKRIQYFCRP